MTFKKLIPAMVLGAFALSATVAQAASIVVGGSASGAVGVPVSVTVDSVPATTAVTDLFSITQTSDVSINISSTDSFLTLTNGRVITIPALFLSNPSFGASSFLGSVTDHNITGVFLGVTAGTYALKFDATSTSRLGGTFFGTVDISAVPVIDPSTVPEPESVALTLAGMAVVGALYRRRRTQR